MINLGVLDLYRNAPGALPPAQWRDVQVAVDTAAAMLLARPTDPGPPADDPEESEAAVLVGQVEVHQATGMVLAQTGVSARDTLARMRAHAFVTGRLLSDVAADIVARRLSFGPDGEPGTQVGHLDPGSVER